MKEETGLLPKYYFSHLSETVAKHLGLNFHDGRWQDLEF